MKVQISKNANVFITKYALSRGIVEAELVSSNNRLVVVKWSSGLNGTAMFHGKGKEWHETRSEAVMRAYAMRDAKVVSLRKQIDKLNNMNFGK